MRIIYVDIDSLRPDHLGCYGYHRNTSPNIDSIAAEATRFTNVYTSDAPCLPSRTALWSGRNGYHTGVVGHGGTASQPYIEGASRGFHDSFKTTSWMSVLRSLGLKTVTFSSFAHRHSAWHWYAGYDEIHNPGQEGQETADKVNQLVLEWLNRHASEDNWFLHINYWDPHTPYRTPISYGNPFENDPLPDWYTQKMLDKCLRGYGPHSALEPYHHTRLDRWKYHPRLPQRIDSLDAVKQWIDGYDVGVRYMDDHLGHVLAALRQAGVYNEAIIMIGADHGESLGELNVWGDHQTADQPTNRVPLIVRYPGITDREYVDTSLHYQYDWAATLIELLGGVVPGNWDGRPFTDAFRQHQSSGHLYLVLSQNAWSCQRSIRFDNYLCIRTYHDGLKDFPPIMLFDLENDPYEQHNIIDQQPDLVLKAMSLLTDWEHEMKLTSPGDVDPMMTVLREGGPFHVRGELEGFITRFEAMGAHEQAELLRRKRNQPASGDK